MNANVMARIGLIILIVISGCDYRNIEPLPKESAPVHNGPVSFHGLWWLTKITVGDCTDASLDETFVIGSSLDTESWNIEKSDSLAITSHGTLTTPFGYTLNGNTLCLKNGGLSKCYTFIQASDTLTLISRPGDPQEACVTERILVKVK